MKVVVLYVGSSLLAPLKNAEREVNCAYDLQLSVAAHNFGAVLAEAEWDVVDRDLRGADVVFVIHVMDGENAARLLGALDRYRARHRAVVVINCMPELMRQTRMGKLDFKKFAGKENRTREFPGKSRNADDAPELNPAEESPGAVRLLGTVASWMGRQARARTAKNGKSHTQYLKLVDRLPAMLRFVPGAGTLRDVKNYLYLFCYFLQPTPTNIRSMILHALKNYLADERLKPISIPAPEKAPSVAIYHPAATVMFESFESYRKWYARHKSQVSRLKSQVSRPRSDKRTLDPASTIGLLLMRPQVISKTTKHYDQLINAIEAEGLGVIPVLSTLMDNREAVTKFFVHPANAKVQMPKAKVQKPLAAGRPQARVSQIVSLTGFSFVGGPAMNDSQAATDFLKELNRPYRSAVSLEMQTIESWRDSQTGLNPVQAGMQIAIPEIDGATEPFVYGGIPSRGVEPVAFEDRCRRFARRLKRWNRLRVAPREELKLALVVYCFPPNKGNIGTAADLDVFPSVWETLKKLKAGGYVVEVPSSADELRELLLGGNSERFGATANVAHRLDLDEYRRLCPYVDEIESDWGPAPGRIGSFAGDLLVQGLALGNIFIGVQPTFGYEGDPMRLMMARGGAPHHGFMAFYTYLEKIFAADALVHVGTHGAMEFMPGKQVGLSGACWPDRLTGELPNIYLYSVNNPSEGSIAKRRSYAELISYLTPPIENAGLYKNLAALKDLVMVYRQTTDEQERESLFQSIEDCARQLNLS